MKKAFVVFIVCLFLSVPLRIWEYKNIIDPVTGFYNQNHLYSIILIGMLVLGFLFIFIFTLTSTVIERPFSNGAKGLGISFILVGFAIEAIYLHQVLEILRETALTLSTKSVFTITGLVTGGVFIIIGMKLLLESFSDTFMRILMVVPIIWSISMLWRTFMGHQTIIAVSEHLFDIVSYIFATLGFLYLSYTLSGFGAIKHQKRMVVFSLLGSLFCLINATTKIYNEIFMEKSEYALMELGYFLDLSVGLLLMVAAIYICFGVDKSASSNYIEET